MDFNKVVERRGTNSLKYDFTKERHMPIDVQPLWVADMDFETACEIKEALKEKAEHGIFGYTLPKEDYYYCLIDWMNKKYQWHTKKDWYLITPGVMFAIAMAVKALTKPGEAVMIQKPVYYPFFDIIEKNDRLVVNSPLNYGKEDGLYRMNLMDVEEKIIANNVKLFILCNPHNPVGRVWSREELTLLGDICIKHQVTIISDEIHQDFVYPGFTHTVFANIKEEFLQNSIICTSPSKTFNLAGLSHANMIIANDVLRSKVMQEISKTGYNEPNVFGLTAALAAYKSGEQWLVECKQYLYDNLNYVCEFISRNIPKINVIKPEGTYLVWLDFRKFGLTDYQLDDLLINEAKLWLDSGTMFGEEGRGFQRMNIAVPKGVLENSLHLLERVFGKL